MKLQKLKIKNFISVRSAEIDFEDLNDGVFLISGPTGSGKSSMLDAIHWVLFGKTLSSNRAAVTKEIRSTYAKSTEDTIVTLTFVQDKVDYKVTRTLTRAGNTTVQLVCPGKIYDKVKEANEMLENIIGLSVKQFDQMVMLEQGNFTKFLLADSRTRAEILRDIFDTQLFKDIELRLKGRTDDLKNTLVSSAELERGILQGEMLETIQSKITLAADTLQEENNRLTEFKKKQENLQAKLPGLLQYEQAFAVYQKAQNELEELNRLKPEIEGLYAKRQTFNDYADMLSWYDWLVHLRDELKSCTESEADYQRRMASITVDDSLSVQLYDLQAKITQLNGTLASFRLVEDTEQEVKSARNSLAEALVRKDVLTGRIESESTERESLVQRLETRKEYDRKQQEIAEWAQTRQAVLKKIEEQQQYLDSHKDVYATVLTQKLLDVSPDGVCPICGAPYTAEHKAAESAAEIQQYENAQELLATNKADLANIPEFVEPECLEALSVSSLNGRLTECVSCLRADTDELNSLNSRIIGLETTIKNLDEQYVLLKKNVLDKTREEVQAELTAVETAYAEVTSKVDENEMAKRSRNLLEGYLNGVCEKKADLERQIREHLASSNAIDETSPELRKALNHRADIDDYRVHINDYVYRIQHYEMLHNNLMSVEEPVNPYPEFTTESCKQAISDAGISIQESIQKISEIQANRSAWIETVKRIEDMRKERDRLQKTYEQVSYVYNLLSGKNSAKISFETFVLHRQLEWILQASNQYLNTLSAGQFELIVRWEAASGRAQGGLEITITDRTTGSTRPAQTFSGGELFMLSLSLSLGLMTAIDSLFTTRDLNLLFVDEGFGTLDQECLSRTLMTLRDLRNIKMVGIISHVQDLIDTIPQGFKVEKTVTGTKITMFKQ